METIALNHVLVLGILMTVAFAAGDLAERLELPRVAAYVVVGALFSGELLGRFVDFDPGEWSSELLTERALKAAGEIGKGKTGGNEG